MILCDAKTGDGVINIYSIIDVVPPPTLSRTDELSLIFDSYFDQYRGVVIYVRFLVVLLKRI